MAFHASRKGHHMMLGIFNFKTTFGCVSVPDGSIVASTGKCLETVVKPFIEGRFEGWGRRPNREDTCGWKPDFCVTFQHILIQLTDHPRQTGASSNTKLSHSGETVASRLSRPPRTGCLHRFAPPARRARVLPLLHFNNPNRVPWLIETSPVSKAIQHAVAAPVHLCPGSCLRPSPPNTHRPCLRCQTALWCCQFPWHPLRRSSCRSPPLRISSRAPAVD